MSMKQLRIERKKRKLSAFLKIAELNSIDREVKKNQKTEELDAMPKSLEIVEEDVGPSQKRLKKGQVEEKEETEDDEVTLKELRKAARARQKEWRKLPKFRLKEAGEMALLSVPEEQRVPLFMIDVQHLILYSLLGHHAPFDAPRWYQLLKFNNLSHTTVVVIDDVSLDELDEGIFNQEPSQLFPWRLELVGPSTYGSSLVEEIATIPLSNTQYDRIIHKFGNLEKALKGKAVYKVFRSMFPVSEGESEEIRKSKRDAFPRIELLLSAEQMLEMGYPLPLLKNSESVKQPLEMSPIENSHVQSLGELIQSNEFLKLRNEEHSEEKDFVKAEEITSEEDGYILSRPWYKEVGPDSPLLAVDCEMCMTGKNRFELTRISIVDEDLKVVYETYVKPHRKITNYLTRFSGITAAHLKDVDKRLSDVQKDLRNLLPPDAILVGQSLNFDLHAMRMMHPYVIDTSVIFNLTGQRFKKTKLSTLSRLFLSEEIQCWGAKGHDSIEDASAAMKLVLLKLSKDISFGDAVNQSGSTRLPRQIRLANEIGTDNRSYGTSIFSHVKRGMQNATVIGSKEFISKYKDFASEGLSAKIVPNSIKERAVQLTEVEEAEEAVSRACDLISEQQLCIVHLCRDSFGKELRILGKWCEKLVDVAAANSLCIVIFGGAMSANGACFIHLKS